MLILENFVLATGSTVLMKHYSLKVDKLQLICNVMHCKTNLDDGTFILFGNEFV